MLCCEERVVYVVGGGCLKGLLAISPSFSRRNSVQKQKSTLHRAYEASPERRWGFLFVAHSRLSALSTNIHTIIQYVYDMWDLWFWRRGLQGILSWDVTPCTLLDINDNSEESFASAFRVEVSQEMEAPYFSETSVSWYQSESCHMSIDNAVYIYIYSSCSLSYDRSVTSSKTCSPQGTI
jgi:hypothetical protein